MKNIFKIFALFMLAWSIYSCKKSNDFIGDNTTPTSVGYRPAFTNPLRDVATTASINGASYFANTTFTTELQFFSQSPIQEINLYNTIGAGTRTKVSSSPYQAAFSQIKHTDTLRVSYTTPAYAIAPIGTKIKLEYEVLNTNTLNVIQTATITIK
ncbi:MAG: hypothetical protein ABJA37_03305 [Ferruginibacter sp.]